LVIKKGQRKKEILKLDKTTFKIQIKGRVQGVGFRPFVFNLAVKHNKNGYVTNNGGGVVIYLNSEESDAQFFLESIIKNPPISSKIISYSLNKVSPKSFSGFEIKSTQALESVNTPLTPDFAVCANCISEMSNPTNRRYLYPFTTCVNCGPRYSITTKFPFERLNTSLKSFEMCKDCSLEYESPLDRRFHSQTNSCSVCGVNLELTDHSGEKLKVTKKEIIPLVASLILEGQIVSIKSNNGYVLCCDATNKSVIKRLRERKKRLSKPFAVLYPSLEKIKKDHVLNEYEEKILTSSIAPIVVIKNSKPFKIAMEAIAPRLNSIGVMLPSSSLLYLISKHVGGPIVCTSGNIHGSPIISDKEEAKRLLSSVTDYFVHHNLGVEFPQDDSLVKITNNKLLILRRSRGFAPSNISDLIPPENGLLAMGAHLKSSFSLVPNDHIYTSQYLGNLDNFEVVKRFKDVLNKQIKLLNFSPTTIIIDSHPSYQSSLLGLDYATHFNAKISKVQHHKAHFASVLGEHNLFKSKEKILGVVWDGTGFGDDSAIWGGEFFIYQSNSMLRHSHFEYFDWLANEKMAKEPRLSLFSLLNSEGQDIFLNKFSEQEVKIYSNLKDKNKLKTSSVGRLFDAVSSVLGLCDYNSYEAEASILLEQYASDYHNSDHIDFLQDITYDKIPSKIIIQQVLNAVELGINKEKIACSFIYTLAKSIVRLSNITGVKTIACSGGVFQNTLLLSFLSDLCENHKIQLKINRKLSCNDENISFGQLMYFQNINN